MRKIKVTIVMTDGTDCATVCDSYTVTAQVLELHRPMWGGKELKVMGFPLGIVSYYYEHGEEAETK